jgi:hypothetical protein
MCANRDGFLFQVRRKCAQPPQPKVGGATFTESAVNGLKWYFNFPCTETVPPNNNLDDPCRWCNPNRNVAMDPQLVDIVEVYKIRKLVNSTRQTRPPLWENAFELEIIVSDTRGGRAEVRVNLFCFRMNPTWKGHSIVKYLADWLPMHLEYTGPVMKMNAIFIDLPAPPSPVSPDAYTKGENALCDFDPINNSSVQIEEMDEETVRDTSEYDAEMSDMNARMAESRAADAEEHATLARPFEKRRRV